MGDGWKEGRKEGRLQNGLSSVRQYVRNGWNYAWGFRSVTWSVHEGYFTNVVTDSAVRTSFGNGFLLSNKQVRAQMESKSPFLPPFGAWHPRSSPLFSISIRRTAFPRKFNISESMIRLTLPPSAAFDQYVHRVLHPVCQAAASASVTPN